MNSWKCITSLRGDGTQAKSDSSSSSVPAMGQVAAPNQSSTTRYYKLGTITNPNQVPKY